jgi:hypothetical protein
MTALLVARRGSGAKRHGGGGGPATVNGIADAILAFAATGSSASGTTYIGPVDTFTAGSYNGVWSAGAGCSVVSGRSRQEITSGYIGEITTGFDYTFDEGVIKVEVEIDATGDNRDVYLYVGKSGAAKAVVNVVGSTIYFVTDGTDSSLTYDATAHRWWRMTEASGDIIFATSPDGTTWTTRRTASAHGMDMTGVRVLLGAGRNTGVGGPFYAYFDNLNSP